MEMPTEDTAPEAYLPRSAYTVARVAADRKTKGNEKDLAKVHKDLKEALRKWDDLAEEVQGKSAVFDAADLDCDDTIRTYELGLYGVVEKNRDDPRYRRYFPNGLREVTEAEPRKEEPARVGQILDAMEEDKSKPELELEPLILQHQSKIAAARDAVVLAEENLAKSEKTLAYLSDVTIPTLMAEWRKRYKELEGMLTKVFATNTRRVDRFFKQFRSRSTKKKAAGPVVTTPPATPPAATTPAIPTPSIKTPAPSTG